MVRRKQRGQALVEFALILPVLMLILLGIFDVGRMVYAYNAVSNAAREGGRTAIINQHGDTIAARAAQQATGLGLPGTIPLECPADNIAGPPTDSSKAGVCVAFRTEDLSAPCTSINLKCNAIVSVQWPWRAITPLIGDLLGPIPLVATTTQTIENVCPRTGVDLPQCQTR